MLHEAEAYPGSSQNDRNVSAKIAKDLIVNSKEIPNELKPLLAEKVTSTGLFLELHTHKMPNARFQFGQLGGALWAIRRDNLKLVEVVSATALAVATFSTVVAAPPAVLAVSLTLGVVALGDRLNKKGAPLDDEQYRLLVSLKALGPTTAKELAEAVSGLHIFGQHVWTEERALDALNILKSVHLRDGTIEGLVTQAANGLWAANGI